MVTMKRIAMTSTSKFSTINFGLAFCCELYLYSFLGNTPNDHLVSLPNNSSGDLGCDYPLSSVNSNFFTDHWLIVSEAYIIGDIEVSSLKGAMDVSCLTPY